MVQAEQPPNDDDQGRQEEPRASDQAWRNTVQGAIHDFVASLGESSRQLAAAAERFAGESLHVLDDVARNAQSSLRTSTDMASAASRAAEEARHVAQTVQDSATEAGERARNEARQAVEEITARMDGARQAAEQLRAEVEQRVAEAMRRIEAAVHSGEAVVATAQQAVERSRGADERLQAAGEAAQRAEQTIQDASQRLEGILAAGQELSAEVQRAADEARRSAEEARSQADRAQVLIRGEALQAVERLEAGYRSLARLVQELQVRVGDLSSQETPAHGPEPETEAALPSHQDVDAGRDEAASPETAQSETLAGRVMVRISPVPDFDRLLSLDGALGRMAGVGNVTLADYAQEEVTFRVELAGPTEVEGFVTRLATAAGLPLELIASAADSVSLRLGSR